MVQDFSRWGVQDTLRRYAVQLLQAGRIHGWLAYDGDRAIGWCNAADMDSYAAFVPEYRGRGIAAQLISSVCADAKAGGYAAAEGYPAEVQEGSRFDYTGSVRLYEKSGFKQAARGDGRIIMRRVL